MKRNTISTTNLPTKLPVSRTALVVLLMDKLDPDTFIYFLGIAFIAGLWIWSMFWKLRENQVDISQTLTIENIVNNQNEKDQSSSATNSK